MKFTQNKSIVLSQKDGTFSASHLCESMNDSEQVCEILASVSIFASIHR